MSNIEEIEQLIENIKTADEFQMRDMKIPFFDSLEQLNQFINNLTNRPHDYGTSCYAMSLAATATFNYICSKLGTTGFQASIADLDILKRTRELNGPFAILKAEDLCYPQYNLKEKLDKYIENWFPWAASEAKKNLEEESQACDEVREHWKWLVDNYYEEPKEVEENTEKAI